MTTTRGRVGVERPLVTASLTGTTMVMWRPPTNSCLAAAVKLGVGALAEDVFDWRPQVLIDRRASGHELNTLNECYNRPLFKVDFLCLFAIISKYISSEIFCMPMDFRFTKVGKGQNVWKKKKKKRFSLLRVVFSFIRETISLFVISKRFLVITKRVLVITRWLLVYSRKYLVISKRFLVITERFLVYSSEYLVISKSFFVITRWFLVYSRKYPVISKRFLVITWGLLVYSRKYLVISKRFLVITRRLLVITRWLFVYSRKNLVISKSFLVIMRLSVQEQCMLGFWNFIYEFLMEKYLAHVFFLSELSPFLELCPLEKNPKEIWCMPFLMNRTC